MSKYPFSTIEPKWQAIWDKNNLHSAPNPSPEKPPYFILVMFPYPSGNLHMGHVRNYTIGDVFARYYRKKGRSVFHPIGWDSFGLPAENAAIAKKTHPSKWTWSNIAHMRGQLKELGISYDWDREIASCDPKFYRWNQWMFCKMFEKGLAYQKKAPVNWCPECATVLANEQVHDGACWRCSTQVIQKELTQWFFKITAYAKQLVDDHSQLEKEDESKGWPKQVIAMQKNWIGESHGANVEFKVDGQPINIQVFTTRPDTLFGATFMVLSPEHPLLDRITLDQNRKEIDQYKTQAKNISSIDRTSEKREKAGVFTGCYAVNPINNQKIPIWIADYVLMDYGTGAIMAVPAHDERDHAFAKKYKIPIVQVIASDNKDIDVQTQAFSENGRLINSNEFNGLNVDEAKEKIGLFLKSKNAGQPTVTYKLRDWLISRQRYWGTPIPIVYCEDCGVQTIPIQDLPVILPDNVEFKGEGESPLAAAADWINTPCPKCKKMGRRETDTMDTFVDSSWYYARYTDPKNENEPFSKTEAAQWLPVNQYVGGIEHACMHLIYSRFFHKVFRDFGFTSTDEPFSALLTQGMVTLGGTAMSKSKGNVVDPSDVIKKYGTDACRLFILFAAPPRQQLEWSDTQVEGVWRFLNRVWRLGQAFSTDVGDDKEPKRSIEQENSKMSSEELTRRTHQAIKRVTNDIENDFGFNTAISAIMELVNAIYLYPHWEDKTGREAIETVLHLLAPFAPHVCEEIWAIMGHEDLISMMAMPEYDENKIVSSMLDIIIQVNGKLREKISIPLGTNEEDIKNKARLSLEERGVKVQPKRIIYVPNKLVNFVV